MLAHVGQRQRVEHVRPVLVAAFQHDRDAGIAPGSGNREALVNWPRSVLSQVLANSPQNCCSDWNEKNATGRQDTTRQVMPPATQG